MYDQKFFWGLFLKSEQKVILESWQSNILCMLYLQFDRSQSLAAVASDSSDRSKDKSDQKVNKYYKSYWMDNI